MTKRNVSIKFMVIALLIVGLYFFIPFTTNKGLQAPPQVPVSLNDLPKAKSELGFSENKNDRREYEFMRLADPATGQIPEYHRTREVQFAQKILKSQQTPALRTNSTHAVDWESAGPGNLGGRTRAIAIDHRNPDIILAGGVSGGMWRSTDGGFSWSKVTPAMSLHSVTCIVQDTRIGKGDTWYYGTGEIKGNSPRAAGAPWRGDGIFKSTDNGLTWQLLTSTSLGESARLNAQFQYVHKLLIPAQASEDEIYAAVVGGIMHSADGGTSWQRTLGAYVEDDGSTDLNELSLSEYSNIAQASDGTFYAALSRSALTSISPLGGIYRSDDGVNWFAINPFIQDRNYAKVEIAPNPLNADEVYFLINGSTQDYILRYNKSAFRSWEDLSDNIPSFGGKTGDYNAQESYNMVLAFHPTAPNVLFLGGTNLYRSTDAFNTDAFTQWVGGYDTANDNSVRDNHFVDQHGLAFFPDNPNRMISVNDGGIFITENNVAKDIYWSSLNRKYVTTQFYTIAVDDQSTGSNVFGGTQDNGSIIAKEPSIHSTWSRTLGGDGGFTAISNGGYYHYCAFQYGQIYQLRLNTNHQITDFARVDPVRPQADNSDIYLFINPYALDPNNSNVMYLAAGNELMRNDNLAQIPTGSQQRTGVNWVSLEKTTQVGITVSALGISKSPKDIVYYGTSTGELYKINDARSTNYTVEDISIAEVEHGAYVSSIAVDPTNASHVVVSYSNYGIVSIYASEDGGESFEAVSGNLEEYPNGDGNGPSVRWVHIVPLTDGSNVYYSATSTGLYTSTNLNGASTTWVQESPEFIGNVVCNMVTHRSVDGTLVVATHGNGVYKGQIDNVLNLKSDAGASPMAMQAPYPNPAYGQVTIPYTLPQDGIARLTIMTMQGQRIRTLLWGYQFAGSNTITWDGKNGMGVPMAAGTYLVSLEYGKEKSAKQIILRNER